MNKFMDENFLLENKTAQYLYHEYAKNMPIIDYHCHISPQEIAEDHVFENITEAWLGGDHYKWRLMRSNGIAEEYITGNASDWEKFKKFAETLPKAIGHPVYHWTHLELQRYFDCYIPLDSDSAEEIWDICNKKLQQKDFSVLGLIKKSNVDVICTTDDPADDLKWHEKIRKGKKCIAKIYPAMRPDDVMNIEKEGFVSYLERLGDMASVKINSLNDVYEALSKRIAFFDQMGCRAADHGLDYMYCRKVSAGEMENIFQKAINRQLLTIDEIEAYKTGILLFLAQKYHEYGWAMQIHYSVFRNPNRRAFSELGPNTGFDCMRGGDTGEAVISFLDILEERNTLPKLVLYSLDPNDNALLGTIIGAFQGTAAAGKIQLGAAWWFNDTKDGMIKQLKTFADQSVLGNFIGMLTDSRSFLSYTRHEYFRRILCNLLGTWVEKGEYPDNKKMLKTLTENISFYNAKKYFGF